VTTRCPSDLRLEAHLLDPEKSGLARHVDGCEACRVRLERMNAEAADFNQYVYPATVEAVVAAAAPRSGLGWFAAFLPAAAACAAALLFLVKPVPPEGFLAARGEVLSLEVFTESPEGARQLVNGELLAEGAPLRFRVKTTVPCRVRIVSADCEGHVVVLYPAPGEDSPLVSGTTVLPAAAKLGGDEGPERIFALCSREPLPMLALAASLTDQAAGDDDRVRRANRLSGLPAGTLQATLLVEHGEEKPGHGETKAEGGQHQK
jgi:hypothetical protein